MLCSVKPGSAAAYWLKLLPEIAFKLFMSYTAQVCSHPENVLSIYNGMVKKCKMSNDLQMNMVRDVKNPQISAKMIVA